LRTFTVPTGVTSITVTALGAGGGTTGGSGAREAGTLAMTPTTTLTVLVGQAGGTAVNRPAALLELTSVAAAKSAPRDLHIPFTSRIGRIAVSYFI
jgi:hypothetical protein